MSNLGLHRVSSEELKRLLRALHRGVLPSPLTRSSLIEKTFGHVEGNLDLLVGRDVEVAKAVIAAVLGERAASHGGRVQLSYMGVPAPGTRSRDLQEQVRELISSATQSLELYGISLSRERGLLRSVAAVLDGRSVATRIVFDGRGVQDPLAAAEDLLARNFRGATKPEAFLSESHHVHLRAVIVDAKHALVTSGELTASEDDASLDLGVLLDDTAYIEAWHKEWARLREAGVVRLIPTP
jgi:hypothetical protein